MEWFVSPVWISLVGLAILLYVTGVRIVPQQTAYIVERLGRYHSTLSAGLNLIIPFIDRIGYRHTLKEQAVDIPEQICITKDNVQVGVDGVIFLRVVDPQRASYGITNYLFAITQLAQTTLRSEIGKITLDRTFEERSTINALVVREIDQATEPWGVKVLRYEIKNINPPADVLGAMEKQMRAEREKRAVVLASEGDRDAKINRAEGEKQEVIKQSEAEKQQQINVAQGQAEAIREVAQATAQAIRQVGESITGPGGVEAINLRVAEQWVKQFGQVAKEGNTLILPANFGEMSSLIATAMTTIKATSHGKPDSPSQQQT
jgi:regulator of protease activity HflC (stomatin/prohibitin superfamily)